MPRLQAYHLHYLDDLCSQAALREPETFGWLVDRWLADNAGASGVCWEPYVLSRCIVNLCKWRMAGAKWSPGVIDSVATRADLLSRTVERDVLGNHIVANAVALVFAGQVLAGPLGARLDELGRGLLAEQLPRQVLPDGGHYERSPMYHAVVTEDLLDVLNVLGAEQSPFADFVRDNVRRMLAALDVLTMDDGRIALFNDSAFDGCRETSVIRAYAARLGLGCGPAEEDERLRVLPQTGCVNVRLGGWNLVLDAGDVGPEEQAGHAHADSLSFELAVDGVRLLVDPGTSTYETGPLRALQRGTSSHNTLCVDGADSSEVWGAFRTARRARTTLREARADGAEVVVQAQHDGYERLRPPVWHRRTWLVTSSTLAIEDALLGAGEHDVAVGFLVAPDAAAELVYPFQCLLRRPGVCIRLHLDHSLRWQVEPAAWYSRFGSEENTQRITGRGRVMAPVSMACSFERCAVD